jgi:hypothetical protein
MVMAKRYSTEEVQQILVQAMGQNQQEGFSRSQLEDMATDLGISAEALTWAEENFEEVAQSAESVSMQSLQRHRFLQQLRTYAVVNAFLLALNFSLSGTITWAIYPLLGWGMGLLLPGQSSLCKRKYQ